MQWPDCPLLERRHVSAARCILVGITHVIGIAMFASFLVALFLSYRADIISYGKGSRKMQ